MNYPHRTDEQQAALDHLPAGPYYNCDAPHLFTARYSPTGFEKRDIDQKADVDKQGVQDNLYWYGFTKSEDRINRQ
jgi:hypothetical protein